jgi:DNA mismatch repair protein MutS2
MDEKTLHILEYHKVRDRLAGYTSFSAGERLARTLNPVTDLAEARRLQVETREARLLLDSHTEVTIGGARDVRRPADNAQRGFVLLPEDFLDIRSTLIAARNLRRHLERTREKFPHLAQVGDLIEECPGLITAVTSTLDDRGEVLDSASDRLAHIRKELRVVHGRIQEKLRNILNSSMNQYLQEPIITSRNGRYVVPLKADAKGRIKGIVHDQSGSGATLWVEPLNTVDLNNEYRELHLAEEEEIQRILAELSGMVADRGDAIKRVVERLAELDLIFARGRYAAVMRAVEPEFVAWQPSAPARPPKHANQRDKWQAPSPNPHPGSTLRIRGARHPLLDPLSVVPIDLLLDEESYVVLITGPNTGGKTVSLKTTGLMCLMAQSGLHLPAVEASLTLFDNVFADIGDEQSIEQSLSTFSAHITNIIRILKQVNERSLVLIDELGSGTDPTEGAALAQAIVSYLRDKGATTLIATHFPELKVYASQTPGATNASMLFDVETLSPTFEMSIGIPGRSNAFAIARRLGLDETILSEARELVGASGARAEDFLQEVYDLRAATAAKEAAIRLNLSQIETERTELQQRLQNIESERRKVLRQAREEAAAELALVQEEARRLRRRLREAALPVETLHSIEKEAAHLEEEQQQAIEPLVPVPAGPATAPAQPRPLQVGDTVRVKLLNTQGEIISLGDGEAEVAVGRLHMRARLQDLEFKSAPVEDDTSLPIHKTAAASPGMELDLRGKRVEDGLKLLEHYLDSAFLANLPWVRIIHGKGTGRMREAVRRAMSKNSHVVSWEEGRDGEGDAGVTVARFNAEGDQ